jgi:hypothetical protein
MERNPFFRPSEITCRSTQLAFMKALRTPDAKANDSVCPFALTSGVSESIRAEAAQSSSDSNDFLGFFHSAVR